MTRPHRGVRPRTPTADATAPRARPRTPPWSSRSLPDRLRHRRGSRLLTIVPAVTSREYLSGDDADRVVAVVGHDGDSGVRPQRDSDLGHRRGLADQQRRGSATPDDVPDTRLRAAVSGYATQLP